MRNNKGFVEPIVIGALIAIAFGYILGYSFTAGEKYPGQAGHSYTEPKDAGK